MKKILIIDYGLSNLLSVQHAFSYYDAECTVINKPEEIDEASVLILPGVGAFSDGMDGLKRLNFIEPLEKAVKKGIPLLGICLGMQMLFNESEEFGRFRGLGFIPGRVVRIPDLDIDGGPQKVPHISWEPMFPIGSKQDFNDTVLRTITPGEECYFIHSYEAIPASDEYRVADTLYGGRRISAVVQNGNVIGTQFHPEKSGTVGLRIIRSFIEMYAV